MPPALRLARTMEPNTVTPQDNNSDELRRFPNLTEKEEAYVWQYLANGGKQAAAAKAAGYAPSSAAVTASRIMRKPSILRAIHEASVMTLGAHAPKAIAQVAKLASGAKSEYVRLEASKDILDRVGLSAPKAIKVGGSLNVSIDLG